MFGPDLTREILFAALLVTTFTCGGLLGLWAATSPLHWFVRAAVALAVPAPLLLRPMYEPVLAIYTQVATILVGIALYRHGRAWANALRERDWFGLPRFSLRDLLLATPLVAIVLAILAKALQTVGMQEWQFTLGAGLIGGAWTLLAALLSLVRRKWYWHLIPIITVAWMAFVYVAMIQAPVNSWSLGVPFAEFFTTMLKTAVVPLFAAQWLLLLIWRRGLGIDGTSAVTKCCRYASLLLTGVLTAFPVWTAWELLHPEPIPPPTLPLADNAYEDLVAFGRRIEYTAVVREWEANPVDYKQLALAVAGAAEDYDMLHVVLQRPCRVPVDYSSPLAMDNVCSMRTIARFLDGKADSARRANDIYDSYAATCDGIQLGACVESGGLPVHWLMAIACRGVAEQNLYQLIGRLSSSQVFQARELLQEVESSRQEFDRTIERERIWAENAEGWGRHLIRITQRLANRLDSSFTRIWHKESMEIAFRRTVTTTRLLVTELACRKFELTHDRPPQSLAELVPEFLPGVPVDPCDPAGGPLRYQADDDGFVVYSVGSDGDDDQGRPPPIDTDGWRDHHGDGDLRLDVLYAPDERAEVGDSRNDPDAPGFTFEDFGDEYTP